MDSSKEGAGLSNDNAAVAFYNQEVEDATFDSGLEEKLIGITKPRADSFKTKESWYLFRAVKTVRTN